MAGVQSFNDLQDERCNPPIAPGKDTIGQTQHTINLLQNKATNLYKASWATKKQFHREACDLFCCSGTITVLMPGHSFQALMPKSLKFTRGSSSLHVDLCYSTDGTSCHTGNMTLSVASPVCAGDCILPGCHGGPALGHPHRPRAMCRSLKQPVAPGVHSLEIKRIF